MLMTACWCLINPPRLLLHACVLQFEHPVSSGLLRMESTAPF